MRGRCATVRDGARGVMADPPEALCGVLSDDGAARERGACDEGRARAASVSEVSDVLRDVRDVLTAGLDGGDVRAAARAALALCTAHVGVLRDVGVGDFLDAESDHFCLSVAAPTRGGKSFLVRALALEMLDRGRVGKVYVFAGAVSAAVESYAGLGAFVYDFSDELGQFLRSRRGKTDGCLVILDDVLGTNADKSLAVRALFSEGRHLALSCFCISQTANRALTPLIKQQSRFIVFGDLNERQLKMIYDEVKIRPATSFRGFCVWVEEHVKNYTACGRRGRSECAGCVRERVCGVRREPLGRPRRAV